MLHRLSLSGHFPPVHSQRRCSHLELLHFYPPIWTDPTAMPLLHHEAFRSEAVCPEELPSHPRRLFLSCTPIPPAAVRIPQLPAAPDVQTPCSSSLVVPPPLRRPRILPHQSSFRFQHPHPSLRSGSTQRADVHPLQCR